jgi:hypothetical protein
MSLPTPPLGVAPYRVRETRAKDERTNSLIGAADRELAHHKNLQKPMQRDFILELSAASSAARYLIEASEITKTLAVTHDERKPEVRSE